VDVLINMLYSRGLVESSRTTFGWIAEKIKTKNEKERENEKR
jgi:hypothetical protein